MLCVLCGSKDTAAHRNTKKHIKALEIQAQTQAQVVEPVVEPVVEEIKEVVIEEPVVQKARPFFVCTIKIDAEIDMEIGRHPRVKSVKVVMG